MSGSLGAQAYVTKAYTGPSISDIDLNTANLSVWAGMGKWVSGFLSLDYDNVPPSGLSPSQIGPRYLNSRVYVDQGYLTVGNHNSTNWYGSVGQMYLPFGTFNSFMVNGPLTSSLFTMIERPFLLGYSHSTDTTELDLAAYVYQGETVTSFNQSVINEWGASFGYFINQTKWNASFGLGYNSNIADAEAIQSNGQNLPSCYLYSGFAYPCRNGNVLDHRVPGFDISGSITVGPYSLVTEWLTAMRSFSSIDMTFNHRGARPQAFDIEGGYAFTMFNKPGSFSVGYGFTKEALALLLPAQEYSVALTTSLWRNTTQSIGFEHDINYGIHDDATGQGLPLFIPANRVNLGKTSNTVVLAFTANF